MDIREYLQNNRLITDGAMGTYFDSGKNKEIMAEEANLSDPEEIQKIHVEYIRAGARLLRTNTFAVTQGILGNNEEAAENIHAACVIAQEAVEECKRKGILKPGEEVYIGADFGPLVSDGEKTWEETVEEYRFLCDCFLKETIDAFVFETQAESDFVEEITKYIKEQKDIFILVQFSFDKTGYTKSGLSMKSMIKRMESIKTIDAYGFNCGMSSSHLYQALKDVRFGGNKIISALPNASYTKVIRGKTFYSNNIPYYTDMMEKLDKLGIRILGGCCGTTPEYVEALSARLYGSELSNLLVTDHLKDGYEVSQENNLLKEKLDKGEKIIMVELDPPFDDCVDKVLEGASYLAGKGTDIITLSDSPLGRARMESALLAVKIHEKTGMPVMPHLSCRDRNTIAIRGMLLGLNMYGIRNLLLVTGDPVQKGDPTRQVFEHNSIRLMNYIKTMNEEVFPGHGFLYGGALNYAGANKEAIAKRMKDKMAAGAEFFLTQPVYSDEDMERIAYLKKETGAKIIVGIMPLVSHKNAVFIHNEMPGINVPKEIMERYAENLTREEYERIAVEVSVDIINKMGDYVDGYYFMTPFNRYRLIQEIIDKI